MFKGKKTAFFWCGFSVFVMAIVQLLGSIGFVWADYVSYSRYNLLSPKISLVDPSSICGVLLGVFFGLLFGVFSMP
jgi:hypothetical protein